MKTTDQAGENEHIYVIADAAELLIVRMLLRQAIPMLRRPQDHGKDKRDQPADFMRLTLEGMDAGIEDEE